MLMKQRERSAGQVFSMVEKDYSEQSIKAVTEVYAL